MALQCFSVTYDDRPQSIHGLGLRVADFTHYEPTQLQHHLATNVAQSATSTDIPAKLRILRPAPAGSTHLTYASGHRPRSPRPPPTPTHPKHQNSVPGIWLTFRCPTGLGPKTVRAPGLVVFSCPWKRTDTAVARTQIANRRLECGPRCDRGHARRAPLRMPDAEPACTLAQRPMKPQAVSSAVYKSAF
ncbi:hypothetical protein CNYM01_04460 [Colletotrichum nymphaeae SA-01]|uniref:Uncharacterized protein n=1 Tax=Colletotrichum nymphaeae SA-01 TaxID=1460502 RepID=A0A135S5R8_9PEZI|nr:hypothetical protein CNYM01_04460 [Colletotrichum nymphaeae SA-01]